MTDCLPRWATPRNRLRQTLGGAVAEVSDQLGTPLMPWQRRVADVALEIAPETGRLAYREVIVTTPRQSGKTTLELGVMVHRARHWPRSRILYSAQTRLHAHRKWEDEHVAALDRSPYAGEYRVRRQRGDEAIRWANGSLHGITAPTEKSGHSEVLDLMVMDEAWAAEDAKLEQGVSPTMITRPEPQFWIVSTAGTPRSAYLKGKVEAGRARVESVFPGNRSSVAFFEWSADPAADPESPQTWRSCMPALGHTVSEDVIRAEFERLDLADFRRAYLNLAASEVAQDWQVIDRATWTALHDPRSEITGVLAIAADVTPDRSAASIAVAGRRQDGRLHVELADHRQGTGWVPARVVELVGRWSPCAVVVDPTGPAGSLLAPLDAAGVSVVTPGARDAAQAAGAFYDAVCEGGLRHLDQAPLNAALAGAARRPLADAFAWSRRATSVDISPLVACTLAVWGHATRAHKAGPQIWIIEDTA